MFEIKKEYERVKIIADTNSDEFISLSRYKNDRELYILGAFSDMMEKSNYSIPIFAEKMNPPEPDFHTYHQNRIIFKQIEIVENLHWCRKRGEERLTPIDVSKYIISSNRCKIRVWYSFIRNLNNKFQKHYGENSWLVMYHNIPVSHNSDNGFWINIFFANKNEISNRKIVDFEKSTYERIFVVNSSFNELICIHPQNEVIFSEDVQYVIY